MNKVLLRSLQGAICAFGSPLGWLVIRFVQGAELISEISNNLGLYAYLLFVTQIVFIGFGAFVGRKEELITTLAIKDSLTGIYNQRFFIERLDQEIADAKRHDLPLSLIYLDLDHFKKINDTYGHPFGDEVLRQLTRSVAGEVRLSDIFARVGGEEFALLLRQCELENALIDAERVRSTIEKLELFTDKMQSVKFTVSLGVVTLQPLETRAEFYKRADDNLYLAKQQGRNRVVG